MNEIFEIADKENLTIAEVRTILKLNFIINRSGEPCEKYRDASLIELWNQIPTDNQAILNLTRQPKTKKLSKRKIALNQPVILQNITPKFN